VGKKPEETSLVFIPTASNVEGEDKTWLINDLIDLKNQGFKSIDIVDISALGKEVWLPRMEAADVLFFSGGNEFYLMEWINKSGLTSILPELLKTRVYAGSSAGSVVTNKDLNLKISQVIYEESFGRTEDMDGLSFVDFYFLPHLNSPFWDKLREKNIREVSAGMTRKIYALDDQSALKVVDGKVEFVTEGKYLEFN
jgi:dipeptidase E